MRHSIKLGAILGYISIILTTLVTLIFTPILLDNLGTSEYGVYSLVASVIAYFSIFDVGLSSTGIRYIAKNHKDQTKISQINGLLLKIYTFISLIILIAGIIIFFNIENIFTALTSTEVYKFKISFIIMIVSLAISFPFSVYNSYIIAKEEFMYNKVVSLLHNILKPFIMWPLLLLGFKSVGMIVVVAALNVLTYVANFVYAKYKLGFTCDLSKNPENKKIIKELFNFSFFIFLSMIVDVIFKNTDQVILGAFCGTFAVSTYDVAMQIRTANKNFSTVISSMFLPKLSKMVENKEPMSKISKIFNQVSRIQMFILLLILSGFIIFGVQFINLWVGNEYISAYYIALICIIPNFIPLSQNIGLSVIQAMNKHQFRAKMYLLIAILNVGISIPLSIKWQGVGAAIGTAIAVLLGQVITMNWYYSKKIGLDIKSYWLNILKIVCPVLVVSVIIKSLLDNYITSYITLLIGIIIYTSIYCIYLYLVIMNEYEKGLIKKFLNIITKKFNIKKQNIN